MKVRALAPAKVNLCLFLGGPRADGRHELVTLFESVSLADEVIAETGAADHVVCPGVEEQNIVTRALSLLRERGWDGPPLRVTITKAIPVAAGMGGGSADAAAILRIACALSALPAVRVAEIATELGADVPSQLEPGLVMGTGAGDEVSPASALAAHAFVVVPQPHELSTATVYARADELGLGRDGAELHAARAELDSALSSDPQLPARLIVNDLQDAAISLCPAISGALDAVREHDADQSLVCGSGPTVMGVYWGEEAERRAEAAAISLRVRFPDARAAVPVKRGFGAPSVLT